ncbi:insulin-like growth factor-binding protein 7 [Dermacentor silvarum]|uniref:insulin-like growth factor-binding protein 7 n=1 Tax=Dermacentor silvarum TaxID=543639 RepID=UPI001899502B|nr:insulin-like growth factor-binding protein 7 [Dermacentor silvarum]
MKIALTFLLVAFAAVCVYATSEPHCEGVTCDPETCPKHECHCGSHKDACGCCDFCNKCANEECHPEHNDRCAEGLHCVKKVVGEETEPVAGHCEPVESDITTPHPEAHAKIPDSEAPVHEPEPPHEEGEHATSEAHHE